MMAPRLSSPMIPHRRAAPEGRDAICAPGCIGTQTYHRAMWNNIGGWPDPMPLRVLGIVLAGGKGTRLHPLTNERAKPAVPFGGKYRIVDFVLSNFINSGIYSVYVLTQFRSQSLLQHLNEGWQFAGLLKNQFVIAVPAQMRAGET